MDTKTPPIPLKVQEKPKPKQQKSVADVSLPPLTPYRNHRQRQKTPGTQWSRDVPSAVRYQDHQKKRPYRVLQIGATPLMHACQQGDRARVLRLLREQEETIGYRDRTLRNALHYCMDAGTAGAVAAAAPELVNAPDAEGHTPLHLAVIAGDTQLVAVLLANGADVNAKDLEGHSVLHWATVCGEAECVRLVLAAGARPSTPDLRGGSPLHYAAQCCGAAATAELAVPKKVGLKVLQTLLEFGADVNAKDEDGRQPILWAASAGSVEAVLALARPALCAAAKGQLETLKILAQHGGSLYARSVRGTGVAHEAVASGRIELIKWLAKKRPSTLDVATQDGKTPLHVAALHGHLDVCKVLLDNGARINAVLRTSKGNLMTALDAALYRGHRDCAKLIQMHGGTTAQKLRMQKTVPNKVFSTKLRMRHLDSSTDTESSPRRQDRSCKLPELYYEEQWIKKRTRRRGNLRKLARQDSRSFSEEEVRLSKSSSKKDHQRRARSESARYEEDDTDRKLRRERSKKRSSKSRHDSSGSSSESDSYERAKDTSKQKFDSRKDESKVNGTEGSKRDDDDESVSDDSLEVVVVRKSLERKCEKVVSGRRSKTPRESSRETKFTKTHRSTRRKLKSSRSKTSDNGESTTDRMHSLDKEQGPTESTLHSEQTPRTSIDEERQNEGNIVESRYRRDVTDSTSQETVERVVVTAMVHKDQGPDTPKSVAEASKEVTFDDRLRTEVIEIQEIAGDVSSGKADDILEQSDASRTDLVQKAASLKKDVEEMRQQVAQEKIQQEEGSKQSREKEDSKRDQEKEDVKSDREKEDTKAVDHMRKDQDDQTETSFSDRAKKKDKRKDESEKGRLDAREPIESESATLDSGEYQRQQSRQEDDLVSKSDEASSGTKPDENLDKETGSEKTGVSVKDHEDSEEATKSGSPESQIRLEKEDTTPRTSVEGVSPSEGEEKKSTSEETKSKSKVKSATVKRKASFDEKRSKSSSSKSDESPKKSVGTQKRKEFGKKRESSMKNVSMKLSTEKTSKVVAEKTSEVQKEDEIAADGVQTKEATSTALTKSSSKESPDEKEQAVRRKSVDFSSSKDSALMEDKSLSTDTPTATKRKIYDEEEVAQDSSPAKSDLEDHKDEDEAKKVKKHPMEDALGTVETFRYIDESSSSSPKSAQTRRSRPSTGKSRQIGRSSVRKCLFESSEERSPDRSAIVAVIESPEWDEEDEEIDKEIRDAIGEDGEHETEAEDDNEMGVIRVLPSTSEEEMSRAGHDVCRTSATDSLPQVQSGTRTRLTRVQSPQESRVSRLQGKQRRDSGGRDSGIEPSPRVSRIPRRRIMKCCPNTDKQQSLNKDTIIRDVQISLRRYHLERKIFFQLMELKRLQIRHGRANEQVLVKRQVDAFHKAGMSGPTLGVAKYDQPLTFRHFEAFLYDQLRKIQKRPATPDFCMEAKQCIQKTHRCHHATSAYTSFPAYTYLGGGGQEQADLLPKIESRGKGQMRVEVTHGEEKQIIALPAERLDRSKKYYVTFTVRGEAQQEIDKPKSSIGIQRNAKSV
ncbi:protein phosphatase 1 regulatory subunit 12A isoform X7 [Bombus terrestris]|uniref:Protein phosphatase 1 regulatory subunit 12A isoform X7 n=1 Tax=Bombus terrestris TaxID=30195 RepID=A0A9C6SZF9_BOMTE|nr:protein phosphatase 1 regulatory subunit 12A isoform X7 [Bombus terrestris]